MNEFENIFSLIHNQEKLSIDYNQFKDILIKYAEQIMKSFLDEKANCICRIKHLIKGHKGSEMSDAETNTFTITISEEVVKEIYDGTRPFNIFTLYHEIAHVYDDFCIDNKDFRDANLRKVCIESGIMESMPTGEEFYYSNYKTMAIELHADLIAAQLTRDFYKKCNIELDSNEHKALLLLEFFALQRLYNVKRDYKFLFDGSLYNDLELSLNKIVSEIEHRYPNFYNKLKEYVGEENLFLEDEEQLSDFESKLYSEYAILELSDIINNPLFKSLIEDKTQYRPKI